MKKRLANLKLSEIDEGKRYREKYGALEGLKLSIQQKGLIHPISVIDKSKIEDFDLVQTHEDELDSSKPFLLLAGGRRFRAFTELEKENIDCSIYEQHLDEDTLREVELEENLQRESLTWIEEAKLTKEIHEIQVRRYGKKAQGQPGGKGQAQGDTAEMLGVSSATVSRRIKLADALEENPDLGKEKDAKSALKTLQKQREEQLIAELARREEKRKAKTPMEKRLKKLRDNFMVGDFFEGIAKVPDGSVDLFHADPDYGIDFDSMEYKKNLIGDYKAVPPEDMPEFLDRLIAEAWRVMKDNSWGLMWYAMEPWHEVIKTKLREQGFKLSGVPFFWDKMSGQTRSPHYNMGQAVEPCFYFRKGEPVLYKPGCPNSFQCVSPKDKIHPAEKAIPVLKYLLEAFSAPGAQVVDGFLGSGNMILAASTLNRNCFGWDLSQKNKEAFTVRMKTKLESENA